MVMRSGWDGMTMERIRYSAPTAAATAAAAAAADDDDDNDEENNRGGTALPTPSSALISTSQETATRTQAMTMMMTMTTTIISPTTIESMGAAVLVPHLTRCGFDIVVTQLSCALHKHANACAFERH